jgi:uncharacterized protein with HEPN domain
MASYNRDAELLKHIIKYCDRILRAKDRFGASFEVFRRDFEYQSSCGMYILQIGELSKRLSAGLKSRCSEIPWRAIVDMRNLFAHDYENIDAEKVWGTISGDVEPLRAICNRIIAEIAPEYDSVYDDDELVSDGEDDWDGEL